MIQGSKLPQGVLELRFKGFRLANTLVDPDAVVDGSCQSLLEDNTARGDVSCLKIVQSHLVRSLAIFVFVRCVFVVKLAERFLIKKTENDKLI